VLLLQYLFELPLKEKAAQLIQVPRLARPQPKQVASYAI
jgi:hypothetical protein